MTASPRTPIPVPAVSTRLRLRDRLGRWRVRWGIGRSRYRVEPGLYRVGEPDAESPVLVTANYKLTFDVLRSALAGVDAWLLVLDTKGINVWCAAGKGTFSTEELVRRVRSVRLGMTVSHRRLVLPQLAATGVAAHRVPAACGFRVLYGPVRARDIPAFLEARMRATEAMRRVTFTGGERIELIGAELGPVLRWVVPALLAGGWLVGGGSLARGMGAAIRTGTPLLAGIVAGTVLVPAFLPWIPGRALSLKGAIAGAVAAGATLALRPGASTTLSGAVVTMLVGTASASFLAMQFTGSTPYTSPSGVEWEMRRALPLQVAAVVAALAIGAVRIAGA